MAEYRGVTEPKPYGVGTRWTINDGGFGYFTDYSERDVLEQWRGKVRKYTNDDAVDSGDYGFLYGDERNHQCNRCGSMVSDPYLHNTWHGERE